MDFHRKWNVPLQMIMKKLPITSQSGVYKWSIEQCAQKSPEPKYWTKIGMWVSNPAFKNMYTYLWSKSLCRQLLHGDLDSTGLLRSTWYPHIISTLEKEHGILGFANRFKENIFNLPVLKQNKPNKTECAVSYS